ncbi:MAG: DUF5343 domain-containing protein, partial [Thermodesulfobacteriota bacterium]
MKDYAYTTVPGKLKPLLAKIREVAVPGKVTQQWLSSIGFKSSNDRSMLPVLAFIGLVDEPGAPTAKWKELRGANYKAVLAEGIREGYAELFATYEDAHQRTDEELRHFFGTRCSAGSQVLARIVATFRHLCDLADLKLSAPTPTAPTDGQGKLGLRPTGDLSPIHMPPLAININIQLSLPETTEELVYDRLFAALRRHL